MKLPKLNKVTANDELRPVMSHIFITKDRTTASNSAILVSHKTSELFPFEFIANIPEQGMYITANDWKIFTTEYETIQMDENLLISVWKYNGRKWSSSMRECIIRAKQPDKVGKFPNWEKLFKSKRKKFKCGDFGLEIDNVLKLKAGTGCNNLRFQCFDNTKAINIITEHDEYPSVKALIMPFMIFD